MDIYDRRANTPDNGTLVRVINKPGCPPANAMGHCYVEDMSGNFLGLVLTNSLTPATKSDREKERRNG